MIRFLWMISVWIGRTSWTDEETEERLEEREEAGQEMEEEVEVGEESLGEGRRSGRSRNSNIFLTPVSVFAWQSCEGNC